MNLHPTDRAALALIHENDLVRNAELATFLGICPCSASFAVSRLVAYRLVLRFGSSTDRRLLLTPAGYDVLEIPTKRGPSIPALYLALLPVIAANRRIRNPDLAAVIGGTRDRAGRMLAGMQRAGFVTVEGMTRGRRIYLTEKGREALAV
jgi:DNA-binding MarR family transcriptional regulator